MANTGTAEAQPREGTFIGKSWKEIEDSGHFGRRLFKKAKVGKWNTRHRLEFVGGMLDENPYSTEVGFFENKEAAYFLIQKRGSARGQSLSKAEIMSQLMKIAWGGDWDSGEKGDFGGKLYTYTHKLGPITFRMFGYQTHNSRQLLIYPPSVSPNLEGRSSAPRVLLH